MLKKFLGITLTILFLLLAGCGSNSNDEVSFDIKELQTGNHLLFLFTSPT